MQKQYDATLNDLIDLRPDDWAAGFAKLAGIPPGPSTALDTDLATTLQADKLFRIDGLRPAILHLELQSSSRPGIPRELLRYNTFVDQQHDLPVHTVLILLRPRAVASDMTGLYERVGADGRRLVEFRYHVERVWERSVDDWLTGGLGLAPLAMVTEEAVRDPESALDRLQQCFRANGVAGKVAESLLTSTFVLCGLRHQSERIEELFRRMSMIMEDSTTYQMILGRGRAAGVAEGRREEARRMLLRQGTKKFGPPAAEKLAVLDATADMAKLEDLADRVLDATSWDDLLPAEGPQG